MKKLDDILPVEQVSIDTIIEEKRINEGVNEIGGVVYDQLGFKGLLGKKKLDNILRDVVLARMSGAPKRSVMHPKSIEDRLGAPQIDLGCLIIPVSKHKLHQNLAENWDRDYDLDKIYRMMDALHPKIDQIKRKIFDKTVSLFPEGIDLMFYDVTTLYFESIEDDELRNFGYSNIHPTRSKIVWGPRDCKFNTTQVVLALATNSDGLPLGYELFSGNKAEVKTLIESIEKWQKLFEIKDICFIGDRAMFSVDNILTIESKNYKYVIAAKLKSMSSDIKNQILESKNYRNALFKNEIGRIFELNLEPKPSKKAKKTEISGRLIVGYRESRAKNDAKKRERVISKITKMLDNTDNTKAFIGNSGVKKFTKINKDSQISLDIDKINHNAKWDGLHGIVTNIKDLTAEELLARYSRLWVIEESFRVNKHNLKMRPIFHHKKERIESHIALCYMTLAPQCDQRSIGGPAFSVLRHLEYIVKLRQKLTINTIIEELRNTQASIYRHTKTGNLYRIPGKVTHNMSRIYRAFDLYRSPNAEHYTKNQ